MSQNRKREYYINAAWRSSVFPSWSQFYKNQIEKAWIILGIEAVTGGLTLGSYFYYNYLCDEYDRTPTQEKYDTLMVWYYVNHIAFTLFFFGYGYNIIDALLSKRTDVQDSVLINFAPSFARHSGVATPVFVYRF